MTELIPHQLHLPQVSVKKILKGLPFQIPHAHMGSGVGEHIIFLHPSNAKKLLTSYSKGKGVRIHMSPMEVEHSIKHGRGLWDKIKKGAKAVGHFVGKALENPVVREVAKKGLHYGADAVGTAVGAYFGNPEAGYMLGEALGSAGEHAIENRSVKAGTSHLVGSAKTKGKEVAIGAIRQQIKTLPPEAQAVANEALIHAETNMMGMGMVGANGHGQRTMGCGKFKKGSAEAKAHMAKIRAMKGKKGKGMWDWADPKKNGVAKAFDPKQNGVSNAFQKTFTPALGNQIVDGLKVAGHYGIPAITGALGGLAGTALSGSPIGGVAGSALGSYAGNQIDKAIGIGIRKRGRPRKGTGVSMSGAYKQALKDNYGGLQLNNVRGDNAPVGKFRTDARVRPSSTEMTLSPYQSNSSPAMNPFVPYSYVQEGGQSQGYGGAGIRRGSGLYGGGLYGGGLF
jgi:hypothetical protein